MSADGDIRPDIFHMSKRRNWVLWDLHQESGRLEDLFHDLTASAEDARSWFADAPAAEDGEPEEGPED